MPRYRLHVQKERLGFSAAHFTLFPDGTAERLHGHNYRTSIEISGESLQDGLLVDFSEIKEVAETICRELDERTLLPEDHPQLEITREAGEVRARFGEKTYRLPAEDVLLLPLVNTTVEELARLFGQRLLEGLGSRLRQAGATSLQVSIEETPGQDGAWETSL